MKAQADTGGKLFYVTPLRAMPRDIGSIKSVVVDEWHELLGSKRGTQTQLCLAHLRATAERMCTWALSATLENTAQAAVGTGNEYTIIRAKMERPIRIKTLVPKSLDSFPWTGHLGLSIIPSLVDALDPDAATLIFTATRSQAERWYRALCAHYPDKSDRFAIHCGSVERGERERLKRDLKTAL